MHQVLVSNAKTGPNSTVMGAVITNVILIDFQFDKELLFIHSKEATGSHIKEFNLASINAITFTITGGVYTVSIT